MLRAVPEADGNLKLFSFTAAVLAPTGAVSQWLPAQEDPANLSHVFDSVLLFLNVQPPLEPFELNL